MERYATSEDYLEVYEITPPKHREKILREHYQTQGEYETWCNENNMNMEKTESLLAYLGY